METSNGFPNTAVQIQCRIIYLHWILIPTAMFILQAELRIELIALSVVCLLSNMMQTGRKYGLIDLRQGWGRVHCSLPGINRYMLEGIHLTRKQAILYGNTMGRVRK